MKPMSKAVVAVAIAVVLGLSIYMLLGGTGGHGRVVDDLIARNVEARGGAEAWRAVSSLRFTGEMDVGEGMSVPYVMEQKRPGRMCLEFVFRDETAVQCVDGKTGWKLVPFRGRRTPEPMTEEELSELAGSADIPGLLFESEARGHVVELEGREQVRGRDAFKLKVTLPGGAVRWVYLDAENGLELALLAVRKIGRVEQRVETFYDDWREFDGLLIPSRLTTRAEGNDGVQLLTVESVTVNPAIEDARFAMRAPPQ